jgi:AcrR family transcriptional regulator
MPRPKTRSDEAVLDAALGFVHQHGIDRLSFAAVAERCGLSAATLVQRFGSKQQLRQRMLLRSWDRLDAQTAALAASVPKTPGGAIDMLIGLSGDFEDVDSFAEGLLLLREDLRDPALRRRGVEWELALVAGLTACFSDTPGAPSGIGRALASHWQGAMTWWAFQPDRGLDVYLRESLTAFLAMLAITADGSNGGT